MSVQTISKLSEKVEKLVPIVNKSVTNNQKFIRNFLNQEKENNTDLRDLLQSLSLNQSSTSINETGGVVGGDVQPLLNTISQQKTVIGKLTDKIDELEEENNLAVQFLKKLDKNVILAALGGGAVAAGLPSTPGGAPSTPVLTSSGVYYNPLPGGSFKGGSDQVFGAPRDGGFREHGGVDITESNWKPGSDPRIPVVAVRGGTVISNKYDDSGGYYSGVMVRQDDGYDSRYLHMMPSVQPGDKITAGQKIGRLISLGKNGSNTHLHFELYKGNQLLNPTSYIRQIQSGKPTTVSTKPQTTPAQALKSTSSGQKVAMVSQPTSTGVNNMGGSAQSSSLVASAKPSNFLTIMQFHNVT